jgi:hypothetical protein
MADIKRQLPFHFPRRFHLFPIFEQLVVQQRLCRLGIPMRPHSHHRPLYRLLNALLDLHHDIQIKFPQLLMTPHKCRHLSELPQGTAQPTST